MTIVYLVLLLIAAFILGFIVLIQNPKGGGLSGSIVGFNTQFMGVKKTNDILENGTWLFAVIIGVLCLASTVFIKSNPNDNQERNFLKEVNTSQSPN